VGARKLLVVLLPDAPPSQLRAAIAARADSPEQIHIVATTRLDALHWLATDEDAAVAAAQVRALEAEWLLGDEAAVTATAGEFDPVVAVDDALHTFQADEILLLTATAKPNLERSLRQFGLPVHHAQDEQPGRDSRGRELIRSLASGRSDATPFVFFLVSNLALLALALVISLIVLLIVWLL